MPWRFNPFTSELDYYQAGSGEGGSGDVVGPASATDNNLASFDGTTGKLIQDSGIITDGAGLIRATEYNMLDGNWYLKYVTPGDHIRIAGSGNPGGRYFQVWDSDDSAARLAVELDTGNTSIGGTLDVTGDVTVPDEAYGSGWNGSAEVPTKNAVYDKIETLGGSSSYIHTYTTAQPNNNVIHNLGSKYLTVLYVYEFSEDDGETWTVDPNYKAMDYNVIDDDTITLVNTFTELTEITDSGAFIDRITIAVKAY